MMGVYINMEMPQSCEECPMAFSVNFGILCTPTHNIIGDSEISKKQGFCPLVPVPPHGDLIDKDATMNAILEERGEDTACWFAGIVNDMPAVIPSDNAEEGET